MSRRKILIVDDDRDQQQALAIRMRASGFDTVFASDGMQAVSMVRKEKPDLVLLDIGLPGGDGFTVIERLRAMSQNLSLPFIALSARDPESNRDRMLAAGADAYFQKPADNAELIATIHRVLGDPPDEAKIA